MNANGSLLRKVIHHCGSGKMPVLCLLFVLLFFSFVPRAFAGEHVLTVKGNKILLDGKEFKMAGLRCSNALMSGRSTRMLIDNLDDFQRYGINAVSVYFMGSRFGDIKGFRPDASLSPVYERRMKKIIKAADRRSMVVLVGCLYWSNSKAKEDLEGWRQEDANRAVANVIRFISENGYRNVFVDPDNEGMAQRAKGWSIKEMIGAGHEVDPGVLIAYNSHKEPYPGNADILIHHAGNFDHPSVKGRPYVETEGTAYAPGGYWGDFSKREGYYNYIRIGRYSEAMKDSIYEKAADRIENHGGFFLASTWLQCGKGEGIGGPFMKPGGYGGGAVNEQPLTTFQEDAGICWFLEWIRERYGSGKPD